MFSPKLVRIPLAAAFAMTAAFTALAQDVPITVQLTSPLSAASTRKGDQITAQVASPDSLRGDTIQGRVMQVNFARGQAVVEFTVDSLHHGNGLDIPVTASIQGVANSKGQPGIDEQGAAVHATTVSARAATRSNAGSRIGGVIGGRLGSAISAADDVPQGAGSPGAIQVAAQGRSLELAPGATLTFSIRSNNGPSLASLSPAGPGNAPGPGGFNTASGPAPQQSAPQQAPPQQTAGAQPGAAGAAGGQPELKSTKIEFVPGERTVYFEDFSDMVEDEPPPHWKVRNGTVVLRTGGGIRELYSEKGVQLTSGTFAGPINFTLEIDWTGEGEMQWRMRDKTDRDIIVATVRGEPDGKTANTAISVDGQGTVGDGGIQTTDLTQPVHFALWVQQGRLRAYLNGQRLVDVNQVEAPPVDHMVVNIGGYRPNGLRMVRIAESAPDFSTIINSTGKYVTHGINFDTDSDRLKPDSAAVLKLVAAALTKNPNLKLEVDGYTDSVGDAAHNLDLSKRRAQAVQAVLVSQFGIDAGRLTSNGFGPAQPIGSNDTPDGRAANRRVEFLKKQ